MGWVRRTLGGLVSESVGEWRYPARPPVRTRGAKFALAIYCPCVEGFPILCCCFLLAIRCRAFFWWLMWDMFGWVVPRVKLRLGAGGGVRFVRLCHCPLYPKRGFLAAWIWLVCHLPQRNVRLVRRKCVCVCVCVLRRAGIKMSPVFVFCFCFWSLCTAKCFDPRVDGQPVVQRDR